MTLISSIHYVRRTGALTPVGGVGLETSNKPTAILLSYLKPSIILNVPPGRQYRILGPKGTLCGLDRTPGGFSLLRSQSPQLFTFTSENLPPGVVRTIEELHFTVVDAAHVKVDAQVRKMGPAPSLSPGDITPENFDVLTNVTELRQGDILPGNGFELGKPETYGGGGRTGRKGREMLRINLSRSSQAAALFAAARKLGNAVPPHSPEDRIKLSDTLYHLLLTFTAPYREILFVPGEAASVGGFVVAGTVCRHRAALKQCMNQIAGLRGKYVRGMGIQGSRHAWNVEDILDDGSYVYITDTMLYIRGRLDGDLNIEDVRIDAKSPLRLGKTDMLMKREIFSMLYQPEADTNIVWRPKPHFLR